MNKPTLFIAEDHTMVLEGFTRLLEDEFQIVGSSSDGSIALEEILRLKPELVLLDITLHGATGIEIAQKLSQAVPDTKIAIVTQHDGRGYVQEAFRAGVRGYLLKQSASSELRLALRELMQGHYYVAPSLTKGIPPSLFRPKVNPSELFGKGLTNRQREVLRWVAEGKAVKEIAHILEISPKTVEYHKAVLMEQLGRRNTAELTRYAVENGIAQ